MMKLREAIAYVKTHTEPPFYQDKRGGCTECGRPGVCEYHAAQNLIRDAQRSAMLKEVCAGIRENEIARTMARYEIESDEAGTAREKAQRIINGINPIPRNMLIAGV